VRRLGLRSMHRPLGGTLRSGKGVKSDNAIAGFYRRLRGELKTHCGAGATGSPLCGIAPAAAALRAGFRAD